MRREWTPWHSAAVLAVLAVFLFGRRLVAFYVDLIWFDSVGYQDIFVFRVVARVLTFLVGAAVFTLVFVPNALVALDNGRRLLRRSPNNVEPPEAGWPAGSVFRSMAGAWPPSGDRPSPFGDLAAAVGGPQAGRWALERLGRSVVWGLALFFAVVMGLSLSPGWEHALRVVNAQPFDIADPVFGRDVAFHVFVLPALHFFQGWLIGCLMLTAAVVAGVYVLAIYSVDPFFEHAIFHLENRARGMRVHGLLLLAGLLAVIAAGIWLSTYDVLVSRHDRLVGANFTDVFARLPATRALAASAALGAVVAVVTAFRRSYTALAGVGVLLMAVLILGRGVIPVLVQKLQVEPAELGQEGPYLQRNIEFTRRAFALDKITEQNFPAAEVVRPDEIRANRQTLTNVRLWDHRPLKDTYNQVQSIRSYYVFPEVDVDRYRIDGEYRQVMLGGRELAVERLDAKAQSWVNRRIQYTHGYGLVMSPVNEVSREGLPAYFIRDVPPTGRVPITRPEIYFGERTADYVIVGTNTQEFDFPRGDENAYSTYQGKSGLPVGTLLRRLALAFQLGDFNLLVSNYLTPDSRILMRRQVKDRVQAIAPFLRLDEDPYLVTADGELYWMMDAYTTTDRFPYSQRSVWDLMIPAPSGALPPVPMPGVALPTPTPGPPMAPLPSARRPYNYMRNAAKITVNAYDGSMRFYLADGDDPIVRTYERIYPTLFHSLSEMPATLRAHVRYPEDLFRAQAVVLRSYHVQDTQVFYNGEDVWDVAKEQFDKARGYVQPYYVIMRLPGQTNEEFLLMLPFTPNGRDNMIGWLAARSDGARYGELVLYKFPKDRLIFGPAQIEARMDQDPLISERLTLWNQQGSGVIRGNLIVVPIGDSTLYVKPIYLQAENGKLPELKRVVVASGNLLAMEATLEEGLIRLFGPDIGLTVPSTSAGQTGTAPFGQQPPPGSTGSAITAPGDVRAARDAYQRALDALKAGDFARFGEELKALDQRLSELERAAGQRVP